MNLISDAEFEAILSAIGAIDDYDQSVELMKMTVELGVHRASRVASGNLGLRLSFPEDPDSTLPRTGEQVFTSFSPDEPASDSMPVPPPPLPKEDEPWTVAYTPDQLHTALCTLALEPGTSGAELANESRIPIEDMCDICAIEIDLVYWLRGEIAGGVYAKYLNELLRINRIRFERTNAGEADCARTPSGDPAPVLSSSPTNQKGEQGGGSPAFHLPADAPPMPDPSHKWKAQYTPEQLHDVLQLIRFAVIKCTQRQIGSASGVSEVTVRDIRKAHSHLIQWLLNQADEGLCLDYLKQMRAINEQRPGAKPAIPAPALTEQNIVAKPVTPTTPSVRPNHSTGYGDMDARAFGPPPVPRSPDTTARRIALTADLILNKANTEQNK